MVGKIVTENLLTAYTELYYRVVFCGKSTRKRCANQRASVAEILRKLTENQHVPRKNDTEKITICHGKLARITEK